ncbi:MAG: ECF-type sigma factor [Acidobacteriota bacterium]|nr:ECF-type sigma factor [Acidobacteriota bacterium]
MLLLDWSKGNKAALDELTPLVYQELRRLASGFFRNERPGHTLQPTALIHEAYVRLIDQDQPKWRSRTHFFGVAAHLMRQILVDHARGRGAAKRGGGAPPATLDETIAMSVRRPANLVALDDALSALAVFDARKCRAIELRFFGGLTIDETAEAMGISVATVVREVRMAEAWLYREMGAHP